MKSQIKLFIQSLKSDTWKFAFVIVSILLLFTIVRMSWDAGMSGDEEIHNIHAKNVYNFYKTFGKNDTAAVMTDTYNLPSYGQAVDNFAYFVAQVFSIEDIMLVRHVVNSIFGWLAMIFASLLAFRVSKKWRAALITLLLMFFSPRFLGHSLNNLKDLNLATAMIMGLYYMVVFFQEFPKPKKSTLIMIVVSIAFAIAVRIGGLLLIAYFGLFAGIFFLKTYSFKGLGGPNFKKMLRMGLTVCIGGYILALLFWPFGLVSPIKNPVETFTSMSKFAISIRQLFEGEIQWSNQLPWYYTPKFILMTIPLVVMLGAFLYLVLGWSKKQAFETFILLFAFAFPVFWITYTGANVYGGWRHSLFAYPSLVVMAGLGFNILIDVFKSKYLKIAATCLPFLLLISPLIHTFKNHPYQYVYFNKLFGGVKGAFGNYELDYYYHSTREASEWIIKNAEISPLQTTNKIKVASWHTPSVANYLRHDTARFKVEFSRIYDKGNRDWDYAIFTVTGMNPEWLKNPKMFPPANTVYTVKVDEVPICIVLKRTDKSDFWAHEAMNAGEYGLAKNLYQKALQVDPYNEQALENLGQIYMQTQNVDSAFILANFWANNVPTNTTALIQLAYAYYYKGEFNNCILVANKISKLSPNEPNSYIIAAYSYLGLNNTQLALAELQKSLNVAPNKQTLLLISEIYSNIGDFERATYFRQQAQNVR